MPRTESEIQRDIEILRTQLTGDLFQDGETQQKIYELKKELGDEDLLIDFFVVFLPILFSVFQVLL